MITRININNFGSFSCFDWKKSLRDNGNNIQEFKRLNIIYGRNYSGKTTLSRIFRSLETKKIPDNYISPSFTIFGNEGEVSQTVITNHGYDIRVYNRDFVKENLSFLVDQVNGEIKTFAIMGEKNKEIEETITAIESNLGSVESKSGLKFDLEIRRQEKDRTKEAHKKESDLLDAKLRNYANEKIKKNRDYGDPLYNIDKIKSDIKDTKTPGFKSLPTDEQAAKIALLNQEALPDIMGPGSINLNLESIREVAEGLLKRTITPTQPIQDLINDSVLQLWVKNGISLHKDKRDKCAFCRQTLPHDIWNVLDAHFSKESSDLETAIDTCLGSIANEIKAIPGFMTISGDQFYLEEREGFEISRKALNNALEIYGQDLEALKTALEIRKSSLFQTVAVPELKHDAKEIEGHIATIRALIVKNNGRSINLEKDKDVARNLLRLSDVASFIATIGYDDEIKRIAQLKKDFETAEKLFSEEEKKVRAQEGKVEELRGTLKDEKKGAERVNILLNHFFGHDGIKLEAQYIPDKTVFKFQIMRNGQSAYNLSEGECSLIAFCYFMAKLEEPESKGKEMIIYIDDPISSLDGNHIFFMFSLIESLIAKPIKNDDSSNKYRYKQLFISTHNLDFLKYLKKISLPNENNHGHQYFMIERNGSSSNIALMPLYLREYITEFNYLFHQIYMCRDQEISKTNHEPFYSFGNNLRKFLEAFLYYKYPCRDDKNDQLERLKKFFGDDQISISLINRLDNELSHLE